MMFSEFVKIARSLGLDDASLSYELFESCERDYMEDSSNDSKDVFVKAWLFPKKKFAFMAFQGCPYTGKYYSCAYIFRDKRHCVKWLNQVWNLVLPEEVSLAVLANSLINNFYMRDVRATSDAEPVTAAQLAQEADVKLDFCRQ